VRNKRRGRRDRVKCVFCWGAGKVQNKKPLLGFGKFGVFKRTIEYCPVCCGNGTISIQVLLDLQVDCITYH
tara:strand:- start:305 stop:517 length:213 start_codon:yes stop_codon:yes gene_type:complete